MHFFTDFADQDVVEPTAILGLLILLLIRWWRGAAAWAATIVAAFGSMLALKLLFEACGSPSEHRLLYSPSGHTFSATLVYGGLLALFRTKTASSMVVAVLIAVLVGWSRLALGVHTVPEVLVGGALGVAAILVLLRLAGSMPNDLVMKWPPRGGWVLTVILLTPAIVLHGQHSPAERRIQAIARTYVAPLLGCRAH